MSTVLRPRLLILVALSLAGGFLAGRAFWPDLEPPAPPVPPTAPAVTRLPGFQLADLDGQTRAIAEWADRALIINFWATWCAPCRKEMPLLQQVHMDRSGDGFTVIGVAIDRPDPVRAFVAETGVTYPILVGQQDAMAVAESFGPQVVGLPVSVFTAPGGEILKIHVGELEAGEITAILDTVDQVIRRDISVAQARKLLAET